MDLTSDSWLLKGALLLLLCGMAPLLRFVAFSLLMCVCYRCHISYIMQYSFQSLVSKIPPEKWLQSV